MHRLRLLLLIAVCVSPALAAEKLDHAGVQKLLQELASPSRRDREQAESRLAEGGPAILEFLPASTADAAANAAIDRIRRRLELEAAQLASQASTITLSGKRSWKELEQAFFQQTGQAVRSEENRPELEVDWKDEAFWRAVRQLEDRTQTRAVADAASESLILEPVSPADRSAAVASSGPCRVEILGTSQRPNLVDPANTLLQVRWRVRTEPRLRPLYLIVADRDCTLSSGDATFGPLSPDARREIPCDRWTGCEIDTAFQAPRSPALTELQFSASAKLKVAALPLKLRFDDLGNPVPAPQRRGGVAGIVRNVNFDEGSKTLFFDMVVAYDRGGPEFESHRMWIYQNAAWLEPLGGGERLAPDSVDLKSIDPTGATLGYAFQPLTRPVKDYAFIYEAPSQVIDVPLTVEKIGIPVPKPK